MMMQIFSASARKLWNKLEIHVLVLLSLGIQSILILTGNRRKYSASNKLATLVWVAYLSAEWVVTVSLSLLSINTSAGASGDHSMDPNLVITAFWAPFFLLHLGGPDTITAYSFEDNELWRRHALTLVNQAATAVYVIFRAWIYSPLNILAIPIFVAGIIKSGERILVLWSASSEQFRESMLSPPDPGPNYARYMEEYSSKKHEGFEVSLEKLIKVPIEGHSESVNNSLNAEQINQPLKNVEILEKAYCFLETFNLLFADLILSFHDIEKSRSFFKNISWEDAFRVIETELGFVYDVFYTKAAVIYSFMGGFFRCFSPFCITLRCIGFFSIISVSVAFFKTEKHAYSRHDIILTYVLLIGAIVLDLYAVILVLRSDWTMVWLSKQKMLPQAISSLPFARNKRWSDTMAQYNLISTCLEDELDKYCRFIPRVVCFLLKCIQKVLRICRLLANSPYKGSQKVPQELKKLIFEQLLKKSVSVSDIKDCKKFCADRGDKVLEISARGALDRISDANDRETIKDSVDKLKIEFDQSILLWHIATDLCFRSDRDKTVNSVYGIYCKASQLLSNYMLYLLVMCPSMLPNGIGQIRFRDTRAEATEFFKERKSKSDGDHEASALLLQVSTEIPPSKVKGDRSKSVLFDACRLAKALELLATVDNAKKWELICQVWVEMLSYAACHCQWNNHAQQLTQGGELLTHVWLLMAHLGITEQFQISQGHERVKFIAE